MNKPEINADSIRSLIAEIVSSEEEVLEMDINITFDDAGIDSLDQAQILLALQEQYEVEVPEGEEDDYNTISKILTLFSAFR